MGTYINNGTTEDYVKNVASETKNITNNTAINNKGGNRKAHAIGGAINLRGILIICIGLPILIYILFALFDLNNITMFKTKVVNGVELTYFDSFQYLKNLENSGAMLKASIKNLFLDAFNLPTISSISINDLGNDPFSNALESILRILAYFTNIIIWIANTFIFLPIRAILTTIMFIPIALRTIMSIMAIDTSLNTPLNGLYNALEFVITNISHAQIPFIG